ncbi:hypothetical protein BBJ28_00027163, partial [Nothophytophthora sp. Chile5]
MELVHDGIMSPNGLSSVINNIKRRRQTRYYRLYSLFASRVRTLRDTNSAYLAPSPPSCAQYCAVNAVPSSQVLTAVWIEASAIWSSLCEKLMQCMSVRRALRIDHSVKFCKRLKIWTGSGKRESLSDAKMLLLAQNEIGQIVGRRLTRSENNEETEALLRWVAPAFASDSDGNELCIVSDNASAVRNMVSGIFGERVSVKQDPFHVVQRISEKIKGPMKKRVCVQLKDALYTVDRALREPSEMASHFRSVVDSIALSEVRCTEAEWRGCCLSNEKQIRRGDLFVSDNTYQEGDQSIRVVSTSQLEGFHSGLKKLVARSLSAQLGLRILDVYIVKHNLRVGAALGRSPDFGEMDFVSLTQAALLSCGVIPESPQLAFVLHILSEPLMGPQYRSTSPMDFGFAQWMDMFASARMAPHSLDATLVAPRHHFANIKELLLRNATAVATGHLDKQSFFASLRLDEYDYEASSGFSLQEYELLRQIRHEQELEGCTWASCPLVTTIMFNVVVSTNTNSALPLHLRSYTTILSKISTIQKPRSKLTDPKKQSSRSTKLFSFHHVRPATTPDNTNEQALQIQ